jgi:hypothetical protein
VAGPAGEPSAPNDVDAPPDGAAASEAPAVSAETEARLPRPILSLPAGRRRRRRPPLSADAPGLAPPSARPGPRPGEAAPTGELRPGPRGYLRRRRRPFDAGKTAAAPTGRPAASEAGRRSYPRRKPEAAAAAVGATGSNARPSRDRRRDGPPAVAAPETPAARRGGGERFARQPGAGRGRGADRAGSGGARDRRRGRDAPPKRPEPRLYGRESVVDRGFDDVAEDGEEGAARRVHWTIIKRSVADQQSGKAMSAIYVLQRDGVDTEYPNLGAARAAANKTIVHPEKLTLSKAEHAAARKQ